MDTQDMTNNTYALVRATEDIAQGEQQRLGQALFNHLLPADARFAVRSTLFDPFYRVKQVFELVEWIENHLIFADDGEIIGVFNNDQVLWEKE